LTLNIYSGKLILKIQYEDETQADQEGWTIGF